MEKKKVIITSVSPLVWKRGWRLAKTIFVVGEMIGSLLLFSAPPLLVSILDIVLSIVLLNVYSTKSISSVVGSLRNFSFSSSVVDVPAISIVRSFLILCAYSACDVPGRTRAAYLGVTMVCSTTSTSYAAAKAFVMITGGGLRRWYGIPKENLLGLEAVILSTILVAIAHMVVAYKTSCRERRKAMVYRIDLEAIPLIKGGFNFHKSYNNRRLAISSSNRNPSSP